MRPLRGCRGRGVVVGTVTLCLAAGWALQSKCPLLPSASSPGPLLLLFLAVLPPAQPQRPASGPGGAETPAAAPGTPAAAAHAGLAASGESAS